MSGEHLFGAGLRALVVDDDLAIRELLVALLQSVGFSVESAVNDATARTCIEGPAYDLVLLDKNLPDGNGLSLARRLVKHLLDFAAAENILVVAEGVETEAERSVVTGLGCPLLQGYTFARPSPPFIAPHVPLGTS